MHYVCVQYNVFNKQSIIIKVILKSIAETVGGCVCVCSVQEQVQNADIQAPNFPAPNAITLH